jgi:hypothetical protein
MEDVDEPMIAELVNNDSFDSDGNYFQVDDVVYVLDAAV